MSRSPNQPSNQPAIHSAPGSKFNMFHLTKLSTYLLQILELEETKREKPERKIIDISSSEEETSVDHQERKLAPGVEKKQNRMQS